MRKNFGGDEFDYLDEFDSGKTAKDKRIKKSSLKKQPASGGKRTLGKTGNKIDRAKTTKGRKSTKERPKKRIRPKTARRRRENPIVAFWTGLCESAAELSSGDRIVISTGILVLVMAIVTGSIYFTSKTVEAQVAAFAELGEELGAVSVSGESGLIAVTDAQVAAMNAAGLEEGAEEDWLKEDEEEKETENAEDEILLNLTSVEKDLKIKFMNRRGGKLISGIKFQASVKGPDGKTVTYEDDDKDGIIYRTQMTPGSYEVSLVESGDLSGYKYSTAPVKVTVKDKIEYKQIDVADEIKTEDQVNVAAEDTAQQEAESAPALKDTVEWVESTKTPIGSSDENGEYEEVDKDDIPDPSSQSRARSVFTVMDREDGGEDSEKTEEDTEKKEEDKAEEKPSDNDKTEEKTEEKEEDKKEEAPAASVSRVKISGAKDINVGDSITLSAEVSGENLSGSDKEVSWKSSDPSVASVDGGKVTGSNPGTVTITAVSKKDSDKSDSVTIKVNKTAVTITLDKSELALKVGEAASLSAKASSGSVKWQSSDEKIASVDKDGRVTAKAEGTATITAASESDSEAKASCKVTVAKSESLTVKLDADSLTLKTGEKKEIKAAASNAQGSVTYTVTSSDKEIAKAENKAEVITVTGVKAGEATITVTAKDSAATATVTCKAKVGIDPREDTDTRLKDKKGNQLYIKNKKGEYVEAKVADYYKDVKFYKKLENVAYKYTGWQTLDGKTYFYDKNGNYVTGEQVIQGAKYVFGSDGALSTNSGSGIMGIDVSKWNGTINWTAVKSSGVNYVIIRCGYRGSSTGALIEDPKFKANIQGAAAAGIKVGVYFFTQAVNEVEAVEEASMVLNMLKGKGLSYPVFLDVESSGGRGDRIDANTRTAVVNAFCRTIQNGGYKAGVYANKTWFESKMNAGALSGYKIWLAQYAAAPTYKATRYDMWQYTSKGSISGISGNVDMNISYLGY